jgi:hypothetical protein
MSKFNSEKQIEKNTVADPHRSEEEETMAEAHSTKAAAVKSIEQRVTSNRIHSCLLKSKRPKPSTQLTL